jgi:hypothetical protein
MLSNCLWSLFDSHTYNFAEVFFSSCNCHFFDFSTIDASSFNQIFLKSTNLKLFNEGLIALCGEGGISREALLRNYTNSDYDKFFYQLSLDSHQISP